MPHIVVVFRFNSAFVFISAFCIGFYLLVHFKSGARFSASFFVVFVVFFYYVHCELLCVSNTRLPSSLQIIYSNASMNEFISSLISFLNELFCHQPSKHIKCKNIVFVWYCCRRRRRYRHYCYSLLMRSFVFVSFFHFSFVPKWYILLLI